MKSKCWLPAVLLTALLSQFAFGWWADGHQCIVRAACSALPADMPGFFRKGAGRITFYSAEPDLWCNRDRPALRSSERHNHFLDLELLRGRELPPTRQEFHALCRDLRLDPAVVGTLPYAIREWYDRLVLAFGEHRKFPDDEAIRAKILYIAGVLSHYTADASQPLHCTIHYDGRANPDGSSPKTGVHAKMDALPGLLGIQPDEIAEGLELEAVEDAFALTLATIEESNRRVALVYRLQGRLPAVEGGITDKPDGRVRALAVECCKAGARFTAALWRAAWIESRNVPPPEWHKAP